MTRSDIKLNECRVHPKIDISKIDCAFTMQFVNTKGSCKPNPHVLCILPLAPPKYLFIGFLMSAHSVPLPLVFVHPFPSHVFDFPSNFVS